MSLPYDTSEVEEARRAQAPAGFAHMRTDKKNEISAWEGDWEARIYQRIEDLGYTTYQDYLRARQGRSYDYLADELSKGIEGAPTAPVQLEHLHAQTADPAERLDAILDSFARFVGGALRRGWGVGIHWKVDVIGALSSWYVTWGEGPELDAFRREIFRMNPEPGWIPKNSNDPIIQEAAKRVWSKG